MSENRRALELSAMPPEILVHVAAFLPHRDLKLFQTLAPTPYARLDLEPNWRRLCQKEWAPKPRYRLTPEREQYLDANLPLSWRGRFFFFRRDALRDRIALSELEELSWHFNFKVAAGGLGRLSLLSGIRFTDEGMLTGVHSYPELPFRLVSSRNNAVTHASDCEGPYAPIFRHGGPLTLTQQRMAQLVYSYDAEWRRRDERREELDGDPPPYDVHAARMRALARAAYVHENKGVQSTVPVYLQVAHFPLHDVKRSKSDWEWVLSNDFVVFCSSAEGAPPTFDEDGFLTPETSRTFAMMAVSQEFGPLPDV